MFIVLQTDIVTRPEHIYEGVKSLDRAIQDSAADMHLFSLAHVHVISFMSGFGQKAAFLSPSSQKHHIFYAEHFENCTLSKSNKPDNIAEFWSGI